MVTEMVSVLFFAAAQLRRLSDPEISSSVDRIVQNLVCADILIPFFVSRCNHLAVALLLDAYSDRISPAVKVCGCLCLAKFPSFWPQVSRLLSSLESHFPVQTFAIRLNLMTQNQPIKTIFSKADEIRRLVQEGLADHPASAQMLYNAAYVEALLRNQEGCLDFVRKAILIEPDPRALLLLVRLLRSLSQPLRAIQVCHAAPIRSKLFQIEEAYAIAESVRVADSKTFITEKFASSTDPDVLRAITRFMICLGDKDAARAWLQRWTQQQHTAEFFACQGHIAFLDGKFAEAQKNFAAAIETCPLSAEYHASLSLAYQVEMKREKALEQAKWAIEIDPKSEQSWIALAAATNAEEDRARAIELGKTFVDLSGLGLMLFAQQDY
jgi:tetratricopeptide (TPR) repeat protein